MTEPVLPARLRLLQLVSPALPLGAYACSGGLESAVAQGWVSDPASLEDWVDGLLRHSLAAVDVPLLLRFHTAWTADDQAAIAHWSAVLRATRETAELELEDRQLGSALARLLASLELADAAPWVRRADASYPNMFALAAVRWGIPCRDAAEGYLWAWCEQQVAAALKLLPMGQSAGQQVLGRVANGIGVALEDGLAREDAAIGLQLPGLAIASALHETQYSRLFRS